MAGSPPLREPIVGANGRLTPVWSRYFMTTLNPDATKLIEATRTNFANGSIPVADSNLLIEDNPGLVWSILAKLLVLSHDAISYTTIGTDATGFFHIVTSGGKTFLDDLTTNGFVKTINGTGELEIDIKTYVPGIAGTAQGQLFFWDNTLEQLVPCEVGEFFWDDTGKRVGINQSAPTALLHIGAGTAAAGTGQIKLADSVLLTTPEAGCFVFSDDRFYITSVATHKAVDRTSDVKLTTTTVTNTTTETTVYSGPIAANGLKIGNVIKLSMSGGVDEAAAADTVTIRIKMGGVTLATIVSPGTGVTAKCWVMEGFATIRSIGAAGSVAWHVHMSAGGAGDDACGMSVIDTTIAQDVTVTATWRAAKVGNIFTCTQGFLGYKN